MPSGGRESWGRKISCALGNSSQVGPRGKAGTERAENRTRCTSQPINSPRTVALARWQAWEPGETHRNPIPQRAGRDNEASTAYKPLQVTQSFQRRGRAWGLERRPHKPCSTEGSRGAETRAHGPLRRGQDQGAEGSAHKSVDFRDEEGRVRRQGKIHASPYLVSVSLQWRAGPGDRGLAKIPGTSRGLAAVRICWVGHFDEAVEVYVSKNAKLRTAQRHTEPISSVQSLSHVWLWPREPQHARTPRPP